MTVIPMPCGCFFEYEPDHSKLYLARWILCGKASCFRVKARLEWVTLDEEIRIVEERLRSLKAIRT